MKNILVLVCIMALISCTFAASLSRHRSHKHHSHKLHHHHKRSHKSRSKLENNEVTISVHPYPNTPQSFLQSMLEQTFNKVNDWLSQVEGTVTGQVNVSVDGITFSHNPIFENAFIDYRQVINCNFNLVRWGLFTDEVNFDVYHVLNGKLDDAAGNMHSHIKLGLTKDSTAIGGQSSVNAVQEMQAECLCEQRRLVQEAKAKMTEDEKDRVEAENQKALAEQVAALEERKAELEKAVVTLPVADEQSVEEQGPEFGPAQKPEGTGPEGEAESGTKQEAVSELEEVVAQIAIVGTKQEQKMTYKEALLKGMGGAAAKKEQVLPAQEVILKNEELAAPQSVKKMTYLEAAKKGMAAQDAREAAKKGMGQVAVQDAPQQKMSYLDAAKKGMALNAGKSRRHRNRRHH